MALTPFLLLSHKIIDARPVDTAQYRIVPLESLLTIRYRRFRHFFSVQYSLNWGLYIDDYVIETCAIIAVCEGICYRRRLGFLHRYIQTESLTEFRLSATVEYRTTDSLSIRFFEPTSDSFKKPQLLRTTGRTLPSCFGKKTAPAKVLQECCSKYRVCSRNRFVSRPLKQSLDIKLL